MTRVSLRSTRVTCKVSGQRGDVSMYGSAVTTAAIAGAHETPYARHPPDGTDTTGLLTVPPRMCHRIATGQPLSGNDLRYRVGGRTPVAIASIAMPAMTSRYTMKIVKSRLRR